MEKVFGKIKWFKKEKGYGYIIGYDEESYFFELLNCIDEDYKENEEVKFIPNYGKMNYASEVEKVNDNYGNK